METFPLKYSMLITLIRTNFVLILFVLIFSTNFTCMSKNKMSNFGEYIRELREEAQLPLRKIAAQLDIDPSLLGKIERNERQPTKEQIKKLAIIYNQNESFLLSEFLSDQIAYKIIEEDSNVNILKVAERKIKYLKSINKV